MGIATTVAEERKLADAVTDEMLVGQNNWFEQLLLWKVLQGPHADEIRQRADALR